MDTPFKLGRLHSVGVVVRDLDAATRRYAEIFGIDRWDVHEHAGTAEDGTAWSFRSATGSTDPDGPVALGPMTIEVHPVGFELIAPAEGTSPFHAFRDQRDAGICALTLGQITPEEFGPLREGLADHGVELAFSFRVHEGLERHLFDVRTALGGYYVEIDVVEGEAVGADVVESWDHAGSYTRPEGVGPVSVQKVHHFGVVVDDVMESLRAYHRLFGIEQWNLTDFREETGTLEQPYYRGEQVDHRYLSALAPFADFGLEIITPTSGPSHYNRDFYDVHGQGIHHMLLLMTGDQAAWDAQQSWLDSIGVPTVMGADFLHGASSFCYFDTMEDLGGYVVEGLVIRDTSVVPTPERLIDFATLNADL